MNPNKKNIELTNSIRYLRTKTGKIPWNCRDINSKHALLT